MREHLLAGVILSATMALPGMSEVKLVVVGPRHFHAALVQKDSCPQVSSKVSVYSSLTPDLLEYLNRIVQFNARKDDPKRWDLDVHTGDDFFERMVTERSENVTVFSGRNWRKIGRILRSIEAGYNVRADKPWVISSTEGSRTNPAIAARSIHHLSKLVSGIPLRRPTRSLNLDEVGEGMADAGTHAVDLVQWVAFPAQLSDPGAAVETLEARRWPTVISKAQFRASHWKEEGSSGTEALGEGRLFRLLLEPHCLLQGSRHPRLPGSAVVLGSCARFRRYS